MERLFLLTIVALCLYLGYLIGKKVSYEKGVKDGFNEAVKIYEEYDRLKMDLKSMAIPETGNVVNFTSWKNRNWYKLQKGKE